MGELRSSSGSVHSPASLWRTQRATSCSFSGTSQASRRLPASYALAEEVLGRVHDLMRDAGVTQQGDIDCIVAVTAGIIEAQLSNDPGGTRWVRHLNHLVDLLVDDALTRSNQ